jgi:hypothetical protein
VMDRVDGMACVGLEWSGLGETGLVWDCLGLT